MAINRTNSKGIFYKYVTPLGIVSLSDVRLQDGLDERQVLRIDGTSA